MSDKDEWDKMDMGGANCWVNEELGNIVQIAENFFTVFCPKIIQVGPFATLEAAQEYIENSKPEIDEYAQNFNLRRLEEEAKNNMREE